MVPTSSSWSSILTMHARAAWKCEGLLQLHEDVSANAGHCGRSGSRLQLYERVQHYY